MVTHPDMKLSLSIGYITCRPEPEVRWIVDSLAPQLQPGDMVELVIVDQRKAERSDMWLPKAPFPVCHLDPKPCVWSGPYRKTQKDWWSKANSLNTFFHTASHPWIACLDDRSVLLPGWVEAVKRAVKNSYMMCGAYQKRTGIAVTHGVITHSGIITGEDGRLAHLKSGQAATGIKVPYSCPSSWSYGCNYALPKAWAMECNGLDERTNGLSFEDVLFGMAVHNNGHRLVYDPSAMLIEDRTPEKLGPDVPRSSKERHPHDHSDKAHTLLKEYQSGLKRAPDLGMPDTDWFDGQPLKEFDGQPLPAK
jgi:hypothetical protein